MGLWHISSQLEIVMDILLKCIFYGQDIQGYRFLFKNSICGNIDIVVRNWHETVFKKIQLHTQMKKELEGSNFVFLQLKEVKSKNSV